jgi:uncharacterized membrane protein YphA (DoxX/SURF4 family)
MVGSGFAKLLRAPRVVAMMQAVGVGGPLLPLLGGLQIAAAIGLVAGVGIPALAIAAAVGLVLYFAGAISAHLRARDPNRQGAVLFLILSAATLTLLVIATRHG